MHLLLLSTSVSKLFFFYSPAHIKIIMWYLTDICQCERNFLFSFWNFCIYRIVKSGVAKCKKVWNNINNYIFLKDIEKIEELQNLSIDCHRKQMALISRYPLTKCVCKWFSDKVERWRVWDNVWDWRPPR